ncbi:unnamed protein product [Rhizophagus irregularis]|uniref:MACPF domain-containing protein n=1 Tax=Rhizophagus irregularis TaxID=588596 RepID=A0A2I1E7T1_9GLOM|nr:hypothetical protein RhiirB3_430950 [Rhizophagus irregularis]CAB5376202.1 unnamed protein product [Rhizophagus irregularis]
MFRIGGNLFNFLSDVPVAVEIGDPPSHQLISVKLNLNDNLSNIRKELETFNIIDNTLSFSFQDNNINYEDEEKIFLNKVVKIINNRYYLYLMNSLNWHTLNKLRQLDYGCTMTFDGIKIAEKRAFIINDCELIKIGAEGYKKGQLGFETQNDWMEKMNLFYNVDSNITNFVKLGLSSGNLQNKNFNDEIKSTYKYTELRKVLLKLNTGNLQLTEKFKNDIENAIKSKDPEEFRKISEKYGQFIATKIILGGRVYFKDVLENSTSKGSDSGCILKHNSSDYSFMRLLGGKHPVDRVFNEKIWVESLKYFQNWDRIELQDPVSIFQLLPDDLRKQTFESIGKTILYSEAIDYEYTSNESGEPGIVELSSIGIPKNISDILLNEEAECNIFATVVDTKEPKNDFFTCQILLQNEKPSLIIHCIQRNIKIRKYKLKIGVMIVGYDTNFDFTRSDFNFQLKVLKHKVNASSNQIYNIDLLGFGYGSGLSYIGIPVLSKSDSSNNSLIIGHFFNVQDNNIRVCIFSYCLKTKCYVNLPEFTFYVLFINRLSVYYNLLPLEFSIFKKEPFIDLRKKPVSYHIPGYISLYLSSNDYDYKPFFLKREINQIKIKYVDCYCGKTCFICKKRTLKISKNDGGNVLLIDPFISDENDISISDTVIKKNDVSTSDFTAINSPPTLVKTLTQDSIYNITKLAIKGLKFSKSDQQVIEHSRLNHGLLLDGQPSKQAIFAKNGELSISLYDGQPMVYTEINKSTELCINFPIAEVEYKGGLLESFLKYENNDENLRELYGHFFAQKILIGDKLFVKSLNLITSTQMNMLKYYLIYVYNLAKCSIEVKFNNLFTLNLLPKIVTMDGEELNTHEKFSEWINNLYQKHQKKIVYIISYNNLIPISQLRNSKPDDSETYDERQPGIVDFKEKLSLEDWAGNAAYDNLICWAKDFNLFHGLMTNQNYEMEISKKIAMDFVKLPKINLSNKSYLKMIKPSTKLEVGLISSNIFSIENLSVFPFIKIDGESYEDFYYILVKFERYEILLNVDNVKPTKEFEQIIEKALNGMKPLKDLQRIFNEYGHLFPQRFILGRSLKIILPNSSSNNTLENVNDVNKILKSLDDLNVSYLLTQKGESVEKDNLSQWIDDTNDNLEIVEFDNIIPLYKILKLEQRERVDDMLNKFNDHRIIMTAITDLKDLDDNDDILYYKHINVEISLEDENYEVFGSIISKGNSKLDNIYVNFGLYDFNGFYAIIKKSEIANTDLKKCYISWMIVGRPSQLSVFSPNNRDFQVNYFKKLVELQSNQLNYRIEISFNLSEGYTIFAHAYHSSTNYEPNNIIKLIKWSRNSIIFQITNLSQLNFSDDSSTVANNVISMDLNICILPTDYRNLKIYNNKERRYHLIGYILTKENFEISAEDLV